MKTRVITAIGILACVIPPLLLGGWLLNLLIAFIIIAGGIELLGLSEHKDHWPAVVLPLAIICVFVLTFCTESLVLPLLGVFMLGMLSIPVFSEKFPAKDSFHCIGCIALFALIARSFLYIYEKDAMFIWYIIIATYVCDTAAYLCGRFFGKHKLNPRVSPKKTWEGSIGGWFFGAVLSFAFACLCIDNVSVTGMLFASMILTITGQIGDLAFSAIKRSYGIKDFSNLLPGHGGVLDRVDSLVFNFICFYLMLVVMTL